MDKIDQNVNEDAGPVVDEILLLGIQNRASDIHIEPERDKLVVRYRIDGLLYALKEFEKSSQEGISTIIKVLSKIDISQHRFPQDGHFEFTSQNVTYNIRVSTLPTSYGEAIVMRVLNREEILIKLEDLGFLPEQLDQIGKLIIGSAGIILITGPSGSGKTTLLYSILHQLNRPDNNIVTVEDPVELQVQNIRQTQVNEEIGLSFSKILRAVLRQDPDVIMLGEIRDSDTAQIAMQSALMGILVLSTFHTFDMPALAMRLMEMGVSKSVLAQAVKGVVLTRLMRKICRMCATRYPSGELEKQLLGPATPEYLMKGRGCATCQDLGYLGREAIFEVVTFDEEIRLSIIEMKPVSYLYELLSKKTVANLREVAIKKILAGETTIEELIRVLGYPK